MQKNEMDMQVENLGGIEVEIKKQMKEGKKCIFNNRKKEKYFFVLQNQNKIKNIVY